MQKILAILFLIAIWSCTSKKKEPPKEKTEYEKQSDLDSISQTKGEELSEKYNAVINWSNDTLFTYKLQETLEDTVISFTGYLSDITKKTDDPFKKYGGRPIPPYPKGFELDIYVLKIFSSESHCIAEIGITNSQLKAIEREASRNELQKGCFIFKVNRITSMFPMLSPDSDVEIYGGNEDEGYDYHVNSYLTYEYKKVLTKFTGTLIDYYLYNKLATE